MIGYYVHHQGLGHLHRALCIAGQARSTVTGLSSLAPPAGWPGPWVRLPLDTGGPAAVDARAHGRLHWAPLHHPGYAERMAAVAGWLGRVRPALLVSDVSVEVACLARLMGIPVVVVAMRGGRLDPAHRLGHDLALRLLAPWPASVPEPGWPAHWYEKTVYAGAFSRADGRVPPPAPDDGTRRVLLMLGAGGNGVTADQVHAARDATPLWQWDLLGGPGGSWSGDPWPRICAADVVVTHGGQNAVAECAAARRPTVVLPQDRPYDEQHATGRALRHAGLALVRERWPEPAQWPAVLDEAAALDGAAWARWAPGDGARRAARALDAMAGTPWEG
ncbi:glycosyl transferase [Streptomyces sp. WAC07061]|uniref:glycosyltransferase n=1 Tax=Streptomyces sp. WAC07061 TaxID=2487410 RepID=UPI000F7909A2|nr:glycosyltransferase [Streptomyces sp. WAC07061]RSS50014.1 glycosyl transferase [Streptomyces sp. WAC07061]